MYDFHVLETGEIVILAADAAGKGLSAALAAQSLAGAVPLALKQSGKNLVEFVTILNQSVFRWASRVDRFVCLIAVALDPSAHRLRIVNAGHDGGIIRRHEGNLENLWPDQQLSLPLGVSSEFQCAEVTTELGRGDVVLIYTDGITGACNGQGEAYSAGRLRDVLERTETEPSKLGEAILTDAKQFNGGAPFQDDVVMVCLGRTWEPGHC